MIVWSLKPAPSCKKMYLNNNNNNKETSHSIDDGRDLKTMRSQNKVGPLNNDLMLTLKSAEKNVLVLVSPQKHSLL